MHTLQKNDTLLVHMHQVQGN